MSTPTRAFLSGARHMAPFVLGVVPFAVIYGASAVEVGLDPWLAWGLSIVVFAGASQLIMVDLLGQGATWWVVAGTALVVNLRMIMYSAAISPHFKHLSASWRAALAYLITDQAFAVSVARFEENKRHREWYFLGAALMLWAIWQAGSGAGIFLGRAIPESWSLDFAVPLTFIALLVPAIKNRALLAVAVLAGVVSLVGTMLPMNLGLLVGALAGVALGGWFEVRPGGKGSAS